MVYPHAVICRAARTASTTADTCAKLHRSTCCTADSGSLTVTGVLQCAGNMCNPSARFPKWPRTASALCDFGVATHHHHLCPHGVEPGPPAARRLPRPVVPHAVRQHDEGAVLVLPPVLLDHRLHHVRAAVMWSWRQEAGAMPWRDMSWSRAASLPAHTSSSSRCQGCTGSLH
jgi:hypothetical protein